MKKNRRRVTVTVTPQTLYHLETMARNCDSSLGEVVDMLVQQHQIMQRYINRPEERNGVYHVRK